MGNKSADFSWSFSRIEAPVFPRVRHRIDHLHGKEGTRVSLQLLLLYSIAHALAGRKKLK